MRCFSLSLNSRILSLKIDFTIVSLFDSSIVFISILSKKLLVVVIRFFRFINLSFLILYLLYISLFSSSNF